MKKILFICLGNICRSPMAETIMKKMVERREKTHSVSAFFIDSAGTYGGHSGQIPDFRMREAARKRGYEMRHRARKFTTADFDNFDLLVVMDDNNYYDVKYLARSVEDEQKIVKMATYCRKYKIDCIPDPYYSGKQGFEHVIDLLEDACEGLYNTFL